MRIFHVITLSTVGGAQSVVVNLANKQILTDEVFVLSSSEGHAWKALDSRVRIIKITQLHRAISWKDIIVLIKLLWYRFKYKPDIIHLHSSKIGALGRMAFPSKKIIYTVHGFDSIRVANPSFLKIEKLLKNKCAYIVGVSKYDEKNLISVGIRENIICIYNGIDDGFLKENKQIENSILEKIKGIKEQYDKIVMCVARDDYPKRIDLFIEIAEHLPQYAFIWIGNKNSYKTSKNVVLLGQLPLAYQLIEYADIFLLLSDYEGLPMSIIEAMACSRPIVASNVGGITELLNKNCGYAVENVTDKIIEKIKQILSNPELYKEMSERARLVYEEEFSVDKMVNKYNKLYKIIS